MSKKRGIVILVVGLLGTEVAWNIWKYIRKRRGVSGEKESTKNNELVAADEVLMFTEVGQLCRDHVNTRIPCEKSGCPVGYVMRIQSYLSGALHTLDVCMYITSCDDLTKAILKAHKHGALVRIIMDSGMSEHPACNRQILHMRRAGIEIKTNRSNPSSLMHHKFAIVDEKFLLFGSTNWTMQAFYGNNDSIIITCSKEFLIAYSNEFARMWRDLNSEASRVDKTRVYPREAAGDRSLVREQK